MSAYFWVSSWAPVIGWAALIFYLSSIPSLNTGWGTWDMILRKCAHVVEFAVLAFFLVRAMVRSWPEAVKQKILISAGVISVLYAISDEVHQAFVPGRGPSALDVIIDSVGVALAIYLYRRKILCEK